MAVKLLMAKGLCGMTPQDGSIVGGLYFMMVGLMQLVFEEGNLRIVLAGPANGTNGTEVPEVGIYCYYSLIALESACIVMAMVLLVSTWTQRSTGILAFGAWQILFDVILVVITALLQVQMNKAGLKLDSLAWCGVVCRIITDPFWLAFIITCGLQLREEDNQHKDSRKKRAMKDRGPVVVKFKGFDSGI